MPEWQGQLHLEMFWCIDQEERTQTLDPRPCLTLPGRENHLPSKVALSPSNNHPFPRAGAAALNDNVWPKREGILPLLRINHNESSLCHCSGLQTPVGVWGYTCVAVPAGAPTEEQQQHAHPSACQGQPTCPAVPAPVLGQPTAADSPEHPCSAARGADPATRLPARPRPGHGTESPLGVKTHGRAPLGTGGPPDHGSHTPPAGQLVCWRISKHKR